MRGFSQRSFSFFLNCSRVFESSRFHSLRAEARKSISYFIEVDADARFALAGIGDRVELDIFEAIHHGLERSCWHAVECRLVAIEDCNGKAFSGGDRTHRILLELRNA